jgi:hypothetical protein
LRHGITTLIQTAAPDDDDGDVSVSLAPLSSTGGTTEGADGFSDAGDDGVQRAPAAAEPAFILALR